MTDTITLPREVAIQVLEALKGATRRFHSKYPEWDKCVDAEESLCKAIEAAKQQEALNAVLDTSQELGGYEVAKCVEPVAWQDHVEQKLLTWRQSFINKSGDQLALDDFMDKRSIDDLIDFVCDEYAYVASPADAKDAAKGVEPVSDDHLRQIIRKCDIRDGLLMELTLRIIRVVLNDVAVIESFRSPADAKDAAK